MTNLATKLFNFDCDKELTIVLNDYRNWYGWDKKLSGMIFGYTVYPPFSGKVIQGDVFISDERVWYPMRDTFNVEVILDGINMQEKLWRKTNIGINYLNESSISIVSRINKLDKDSLSHVMGNVFNKPVYLIEG